MNTPPLPNERASAAEVVQIVKHGDRVFVHGACASPTPLLEALVRDTQVDGVDLYHLHIGGPFPFDRDSLTRRFRSVSLFTGEPLRKPIEEGIADYVPVFLSEIPSLFRERIIPLDVALVQLSPPDKHGYCTLGTSCDAARAAVDSAAVVLAEINSQMPRTHGATAIHVSKITAFVRTDRPLPEAPPATITEVEARIGELVAALVDHGSTLQMGIGAIPDAVLARLGDKIDLGVHTEMFSDGLLPLLEGGVITNKKKSVHPGRTVTSFVSGTKKVFDHVDDNMRIEFHPCDRTNDTFLIRKNDKVVAINSCIEVDLSGQVCSDSIGHRIYSGIGGQMDFIRAAAMSNGGKPILALPSTAGGGRFSRIATSLKPGAGVVTTRGHAHWIVTEYGAVNLHGRSLRKRAEMLIGIAHPDFRAELTRELNAIRHFDLAPPSGS